MSKKSKTKKKNVRDPLKDYVYVIPDTNGDAELLRVLIQMVVDGDRFPLTKKDTVVFLGQYIGYDTKRTIEIIRGFEKNAVCKVVALTGPDDYKFMNARPLFFKSELGNSAVQSYRLKFNNKKNYRNNALDLEAMMDDRNWLAKLHSFYIHDDLFFCHGGVDPRLPLEKQNVGALMFNSKSPIVSPAIKEFDGNYENIIIHSGSPTTGAKPFVKMSKAGTLQRINVNTDAKTTGWLSCSVIDGKTGELVTTISSFYEKKYEDWKNKQLEKLIEAPMVQEKAAQ